MCVCVCISMAKIWQNNYLSTPQMIVLARQSGKDIIHTLR